MTAQQSSSIFSPDADKALEDGWNEEADREDAAGKPAAAAQCRAEAKSPGTIMSQSSKP